MKIRSLLPRDRTRAGTIDIVNDAGELAAGRPVIYECVDVTTG